MRTQTPHNPDYGTCYYTHAWLRIMSEDCDVDEITSLVKARPTETQKNGDNCSEIGLKKYRKSGWFLSSEGEITSKDSRDHLDYILSRLDEADPGFRTLHSREYLIDICIRWDSMSGHGGPTLSPAQMIRLAELEIEVWFDIYFHGDDFASEEEDATTENEEGEQVGAGDAEEAV